MKNVCEYRYKHLHTCLFTYICLERQWNLGQRGKVLVFLAMMCRLWDLLHGEKEALIFREVVSGKWPAVCLHPAHTSKTFENAPQWSPMAQDLCGLSREEIMLKITRTEFSVFHTSTMNCWVLTRCHFLPCKMQGANGKKLSSSNVSPIFLNYLLHQLWIHSSLASINQWRHFSGMVTSWSGDTLVPSADYL